MSIPAYLSKEIAAQEAAEKANDHPTAELVEPHPMVVGQASVGSQLSPAAEAQVNQAQNANLAFQNQDAPSPSILDLPAEVKANIVGYEDMELDEMIQRIINARSQAVNCDRIIQLLWVEFKKNPPRVKVQNHLRKLGKEGFIAKAYGRSAYQRLPAQTSIFDNKPQKE